MGNYAHPETLVTTDWVAQHASDANVRITEVDVDTKAYDEGHVPGNGAAARKQKKKKKASTRSTQRNPSRHENKHTTTNKWGNNHP